jgi:hypothetical protein
VFDVAILMDGFTVFVGGQIDRKIDWLGANCAGYFWERVATHKCLLWTVTRRLNQRRSPVLFNTDQFHFSTSFFFCTSIQASIVFLMPLSAQLSRGLFQRRNIGLYPFDLCP